MAASGIAGAVGQENQNKAAKQMQDQQIAAQQEIARKQAEEANRQRLNGEQQSSSEALQQALSERAKNLLSGADTRGAARSGASNTIRGAIGGY